MRKKFWIEDIECLFKEYQILPIQKMYYENKMNCITRLVILIFLILVFFEVFSMKNNLLFLFFSLLIIIILYYNQKNNMSNENYINNQLIYKEDFEDFNNKTYNPERTCSQKIGRINYMCSAKDNENIPQIKYNLNKYGDQYGYNTKEYNPNFKTPTDNQKLAGKPNPKTLVPPVIPTPALNHAFWKKDRDSTISIINSKKKLYEDESGYNFTTDYLKNFKKVEGLNNCPMKLKRQTPKLQLSNNVSLTNTGTKLISSDENFEIPYEIKDKKNFLNEPESLFYKDFKNNPYFKNKYKENIYDEIITPGVYKKNVRNEPINSNIGITTTTSFEDDGMEVIEPFESVNTSNVYDPRFYGYGTSYRGYIDENVGQPRFYYDDVNSVRMPNYITRNSIDVTSFGDAYGSLNSGNPYSQNIQSLADQHYHDSMLSFRTGLQESLMRKVNAESWQQKMYPIHKNFR